VVQGKFVPRVYSARYLTKYVQIWEYFLAYSIITSRQGGATCYQICLVKNINSTHRVEGIPTQFGLSGALAAGKFNIKTSGVKSDAGLVQEKVASAISETK
jgi:sphingolipid C9-methyltransferase